MKATTITEMPDEGAILDTLVAMEKGEKKRGRKSVEGKEMYTTKETCPAPRSVKLEDKKTGSAGTEDQDSIKREKKIPEKKVVIVVEVEGWGKC